MPAKAPTQLALKVGFLHLNPSTLRGVSWVVTKWFISHVIKVVSCKYRTLLITPLWLPMNLQVMVLENASQTPQNQWGRVQKLGVEQLYASLTVLNN